MSDTRPNILMIVTDQEYANQALPAGVPLPSRDRLHAGGVTFNNHQATTTVCTPSRSVMWTGQHTPFTGMFDNTNYAWTQRCRGTAWSRYGPTTNDGEKNGQNDGRAHDDAPTQTA